MAKKETAEDILKAIIEKGGKGAGKAQEAAAAALGDAAKELKNAAEAQKQATKETKEATKEAKKTSEENKKAASESTKAARQSTAATKENQKRATQQSKDTNRLSNVVQKLSGGVVGGTAKNIGSLVGGSIRQSTFGGMFNARAMMGATLQSVGLEQIVPAAVGGGGRGNRSVQAAGQESKSEIKQISIFQSIEETLKSILKFTKENNLVLMDLAESWQANARERIEAAREAARAREGGTEGAGLTKKETDSTTSLGLIIAGLAASLGAIKGLFSAWIRTLETFAELFRLDKLKAIFNEKVMVPIVEFFEGIAASIKGAATRAVDEVVGAFEIVKSKAGEIATKLTTAIEEAIESMKGGFKNLGIGEKFTNTLNFFREAFGPLIRPFEEAATFIGEMASADGVASKFSNVFKSIKEFFSPVITFLEDTRGVVGTLLESVGKFASVFKFVATVVEKLAWPLMVVMAVWDTVSGAIEGYKQEGFVGAVKGAITGLFDSIVGMPLDLVKDITSWLLAKMGFENAAKLLDSFSFQDLFKKLVDTVSNSISYVINGISKLFTDLPKLLLDQLPDGWVKDKLKGLIGATDKPTGAAQSGFASMAAAGPAMPLAAKTNIQEVDMDMGEGVVSKQYQATTSYTPLVNTKNMSMAAQSGFNAMAAAGQPKVIVMPGSGTMNASREPPSNPRSSGAVSTAPAPSLQDRTLNTGAFFGAGHP